MAKAKKLEDLMDAFFSTRRDDPIRTQHASAADFDEFSDEAFDSGAGDQWYGMGHYFASNPKVTNYYADLARKNRGNELGDKPGNLDTKHLQNMMDFETGSSNTGLFGSASEKDTFEKHVTRRARDLTIAEGSPKNIADWSNDDFHSFQKKMQDKDFWKGELFSIKDPDLIKQAQDRFEYEDQVDWGSQWDDKAFIPTEKYAMKYHTNLHFDKDRLLDIDAPVEDAMLELIKKHSKMPPDKEELVSAWHSHRIHRLSKEIEETDNIAYRYDLKQRLKGAIQELQDRFKEVGLPPLNEAAIKSLRTEDNHKKFLDKYVNLEGAEEKEIFDIDKFKEFTEDNIPQGGYGELDKDDFTIRNHDLVNYLDSDEISPSYDRLRGQNLLKKIGLQGSYHDNSGMRKGVDSEELHNFVSFYPELVEIIKKEKGNITLPMLATLASAGAALPPAATKLLKQREKKLANELFGGVLTGAASGAVGGLADILDWVSGRSSPNPDLGIEIAGKGADKLEDIQGSILKWADEQGWNDKGAQTLGELIAPGL